MELEDIYDYLLEHSLYKCRVQRSSGFSDFSAGHPPVLIIKAWLEHNPSVVCDLYVTLICSEHFSLNKQKEMFKYSFYYL